MEGAGTSAEMGLSTVMSGWLAFITTMFDNRQIATGLWLFSAFLFCLFHSELRSSIHGLFKAILDKKLLFLFSSHAVYVVVLAWVLGQFGIWKVDQVSATILWYLCSGAVSLGRSIQADEEQNFFRNLLFDNFRLLVVFEFVVVGYTFSLLTELLFVPLMVFLGLLIAFSDTKKEYYQVHALIQVLLVGIVLVLVWQSISSILAQPAGFFTYKNGRNFLLPMLLTTLSIPFFYLWYCISQVERAQIRMDLKNFPPDELKRYARKKFFLRFALRPVLLHRAVRQFQSMQVEKKVHVDTIVRDIRIYERQSKNPPVVDEIHGWSPYLARDFLKSEGLQTSDYHRGPKVDEWWADSTSIDLDRQNLLNTANYFLEGEDGIVHVLKLMAHFMDEPDPSEAIEKYTKIAGILVLKATNKQANEINTALDAGGEFNIIAGHTKATWELERFSNGRGFNLCFTLQRG